MDKNIREKIGKNLKKYREERGYTQLDIAIYLGNAPTTIASWEQGLSSPDIETAYRLMKYYNLLVDDIFEGL